MWLIILSDQLPIIALVSLYLTNKLIGHRPTQSREALRSPTFPSRAYAVLIRLSPGYPPLLGTFRCITHPFATRRQGCPHCPIFPTAASRRSLGRVSVPVWLIFLSEQLSIIALVGSYPTN